MRFAKVLGVIVLCLFALTLVATAGQKSLGVAAVSNVTFSTPVRVGTSLLRAGDYTVTHVMEGEDHVMVFTPVRGKNKEGVKVKCTLVPLAQKAGETSSTYDLNASNERVLRELVFRGDTAKHVLQ